MDAPKEALKKICQYRKPWIKAFEKQDMLPYLLCVEIGNEIIEDIALNRNTQELKSIFTTIEEIYKSTEDIEVTSLITAGLFSAMQNKAYDDLNPPDLVNNYLGPESLKHWGDYIEGWSGKGIRTISAWKNLAK